MAGRLQKFSRLTLVAGSLAALAACSPTGFGRSAPTMTVAPPRPAPILPVQTGSVQTSNLPPIAGSTVLPSTSLPGNTASTPGFGLDDFGSVGSTTGGRDLSGTITMQRLLGGWTVQIGAEQCRLNLTYTAKGATGRYRASTPGCGEPTLATVTSWLLLGEQIQLYNGANELIGTLLRSGDRFVGTLAGGRAISMVG